MGLFRFWRKPALPPEFATILIEVGKITARYDEQIEEMQNEISELKSEIESLSAIIVENHTATKEYVDSGLIAARAEYQQAEEQRRNLALSLTDTNHNTLNIVQDLTALNDATETLQSQVREMDQRLTDIQSQTEQNVTCVEDLDETDLFSAIEDKIIEHVVDQISEAEWEADQINGITSVVNDCIEEYDYASLDNEQIDQLVRDALLRLMITAKQGADNA